MKIKIKISLLVSGMFLFIATAGVASWELSCNLPAVCDADLGKGGVWQVELISGPTLVTQDCRIENLEPGEDCYEYQYILTPPSPNSPLSQVNMALPSSKCKLKVSSDPNQTYPPGQGEPTYGFGAGIYNVWVARFPPEDENDNLVIIQANTATVGLITVAIGSKSYIGSCGIAGPDMGGFEPTEKFTFNSYEEVTTSDGKKFKFTRDPDTNCVITAEKLENGAWTPMTQVPIGDYLKTAGGQEINFVGHQNQRCYESWVNSNPWAYVNGRWIYY